MKVKDLLLGAAKEIREHGHVRNRLVDNSGAHCMYGALNVALTGQWYWPKDATAAYKEVDAALVIAIGGEDKLPSRCGCGDEKCTLSVQTVRDKLVCWNNAKERTQDEVLAALEKAAAIAPDSEVAS